MKDIDDKIEAVVLAILAIVALYCVYLGYNYDEISLDRNHEQPGTSINMFSRQNQNITLLGTDTGDLGRHSKGRTDTIIVDSLSPKNDTDTLTSVPRDSYANFNSTTTKINGIYTMAGVNNTDNYLSNWLHANLHNYILVNMGGLRNIINDVGGVTVKSPLSFKYGDLSIKKGQTRTLNGKLALDYARMRHTDPLGDYGRQIRQRQILMSLFQEVKKPSIVLRHPFMPVKLMHNIQSNLPFRDLIAMETIDRSATDKINSQHLQGNTQQINGQDFEVVPNSQIVQKTKVMK